MLLLSNRTDPCLYRKAYQYLLAVGFVDTFEIGTECANDLGGQATVDKPLGNALLVAFLVA